MIFIPVIAIFIKSANYIKNENIILYFITITEILLSKKYQNYANIFSEKTSNANSNRFYCYNYNKFDYRKIDCRSVLQEKFKQSAGDLQISKNKY